MANSVAPTWKLTDDDRTLVIRRRLPSGVISTVTLHRQDGAGPFTAADVARAVLSPARTGLAGQHNRCRRTVTRFGTLWTYVMTGPPTWWAPQARREKDGTLMAGWLRLAIAVRFDRS